MKLFLKYLYQRRAVLCLFAVFCAIFAAVFALYKLPIKAAIYPALLCDVIGAVFILWDYARLRRIHQSLCAVKNLSAAMISSLPEADTIESADYHEIIAALKEEISALETSKDISYRDMTEYYTVWAHQIKTPIASMRLTLQSEDTPLSRRLSSDLFRIEQYVEMVLAFLRLDSTSSDYVFKEYSIDAVVSRAVKKFAPEFILRKLRLEYEPIKETVVTDEKWLSFVIEQVLSNALKYTRRGGVKIYMTEPRTLCIEDSGIGIAPEDLPRIFENGYTGYNGRIDEKASGIGLYLCKRICGRLGAEISVSSELDNGTKVYIDLNQYEIAKE